LSEAQTQLTDLQLVGNYAIQPTWADGHHTGFYTFRRLREECPCPADTEQRAKERAAHGEHSGPTRLG
ncbi:MAG TPA: gamma-butyrobetaine hydroxylase-like domain-containing protein, partial [Candidatus Limnocylindrales bacterium]|nr:gamma-butyrobetaine hydroxylase-like domain-containing protein [Candidatus Limnocylindrales bacterium]